MAAIIPTNPPDPTKTPYTYQLYLIRECMRKVLTGTQSGSYGNRSWTMANLEELSKLEDKYAALSASELANCRGRGRSRLYYFTPVT